MRYVSTGGRRPPSVSSTRSCAGLAPTAASMCPRTGRPSPVRRSPPSPARPMPRWPPPGPRPASPATRSPQDVLRRHVRRGLRQLHPRRRGPAGARSRPAASSPSCSTGRAWPSRTWPCSCWRGCRDHVLGRQKPHPDHPLRHLGRCTGGAAVEAFRGRSNTKIVVMFPDGRISEVQRRFMTTADEANVACVAVAGDFDDCQAILKTSLQDAALKQAVGLSAVNSINFARIVAQSVYYFTTAPWRWARRIARSRFAVPSGNFGDGFAGYVAKRMGLPIAPRSSWRPTPTTSWRGPSRGPLCPRRDRPDPVAGHGHPVGLELRAALFRVRPPRRARDGLAPSPPSPRPSGMDIPPRGLWRPCARPSSASAIGEGDTTRTIVATLRETGEMIDPHTAVGVAAPAASRWRDRRADRRALHRPPGQVPRAPSRPPPARPRSCRAAPSALAGQAERLRPPAGRRRRHQGLCPGLCRSLTRAHRPPAGQRRAGGLRPHAPGSRPWRSRWSPAAARARRTRRPLRLVAPPGAHGSSRARARARPATSSR